LIPPTSTDYHNRRMNMDATIQIFNDKNGKFRFKLVNVKGDIIAISESYTTKEKAMKGIESVKKNASLTLVEDKTV
jgi:uncharacterized protein YegP (UPF0339 family)